jgi:glucose/arabinose dehydrogenase
MAGRVARVILSLLLAAAALPAFGQSLPTGFRRTDPIINRLLPTGVQFAHDGRVFVPEKSGKIYVYQNLLDTNPQLVVDLSLNVHDNWDRGLLGFALDPGFPEVPYMYVQYAYNGGLFPGSDPVPWVPRWPSCAPGDLCGVNGGTDYCPSPPGDTTNGGGCVIAGRVSRLTVSGNTAGNEQVLVEDWYQQFPSHSIGTIAFGPDGYLYAGGGDGASFNGHDYGQWGSPTWPDQRSPLNPGNPNDQATNHGGSLRSLGLEVENLYNANGNDVWLSGSIIRIDPTSGAGAPGNPLAADPHANAQRIIAYGLRNPFRFAFRPGSGDVWVGDVGENTWEEINRIPALAGNPTPSLQNFGWPCYEGRGHHAGFSGPICTAMYSGGDTGGRTRHAPPWYTYVHSGSSDVTGLVFYTGTSYPLQYRNSLFFADNSRQIIFNIPFVDANGDGVADAPADSAATAFFGGGNATSVNLASGPGADVFFANINTGKISRISYCSGGCTNLAPSAAIALAAGSTANGAPRTVAFTAANSIDPNAGDTLSYAWDLDNDGAFDDAVGAGASMFYTANGPHDVAVQVTDSQGSVDVARMRINVGNTAPSVTITSPASNLPWSSGDSIALTATSNDAEQGSLPDSALAWQVYREDCTNPDFTGCTETSLGTFTGSSTGFVAPDAAFPAYLRIVLTGTDSGGLTATQSVSIYPLTASVTLASDPPGLLLSFAGGAPTNSQSAHTVIVNAGFAVAAPSPQIAGAMQVLFDTWSDGGAASHVAHATSGGALQLLASFVAPADLSLGIDDGATFVNTGQMHSWTIVVDNVGVNTVTGASVTSSASGGLDVIGWTCAPGDLSTCGASGNGEIADTATIASGEHVTYVVTAYVRTDAPDNVAVSASVLVPASYLDLSPSDDSASDADAVHFDLIFRDGFDATP